jgi:hypothetical protein
MIDSGLTTACSGRASRAADAERYPPDGDTPTNRFELILPNQLGSISLGCSPSLIYREFGHELTWEEWMGGNRNGDLYYRGLIFGFDACDSERPLANSKLIVINGLARDDIYFQGRMLRSWHKKEIERMLKREQLSFRPLVDGIEVVEWNFEFSFDEFGNCDGFYMHLPQTRTLPPND